MYNIYIYNIYIYMVNQERITLTLLLWDLNTLCRELLLASFLHISNVWKFGNF